MSQVPWQATAFRHFLQYRWFMIAMAIYLASLVLFGVIHFRHTRDQALQEVDSRLKSAAFSLDHLLGTDFHDRFYHPDQMDAPSDLKWVLKVTSLNRDLQLDYVYAMVERDGHIYFTAANANEEELRQGTHHAYFRPYPDAAPEVYQALKTGQVQYLETLDSWGHFRTVLIPRTSPKGRPYVLAADISLAKLGVTHKESLRKTLWLGILYVAVTLPLLLLYAWPIKQRLYIHPVTGLPNRNRLEKDLDSFNDPQVTLINIDGFHQINDFFGAAHGNTFLRLVAHRIQALLTRRDRLYKLGADEYVIVREIHPDTLPIETFILALNQQQIDLANTRIPLAVSAGVADGKLHALEHADLALKQARNLNRGVAVYSESLQSSHDFESNLAWTRILKEAIDDGRIIAWFQPIHDNLWNEICHYEALVRLVDREGNIIGPGQFLSVARRSRLLGRLSLIMLEQALIQAERTGHNYSVNLTIENLTHPESSTAIIRMLRHSSAAERIILEIVESEGIEHLDRVQAFIQEAKKLGASIAIDDFGTGYSNFKHLLELPVDYIKIDGSLIQQITHSAMARAVVSAIVTFANQLDAKVVAEYVSDEQIQKTVLGLKIHLSQGYLFGPPVPASESSEEDEDEVEGVATELKPA